MNEWVASLNELANGLLGGFVCVKFLLIFFLLNKNKFNLKKKKFFFLKLIPKLYQ